MKALIDLVLLDQRNSNKTEEANKGKKRTRCDSAIFF